MPADSTALTLAYYAANADRFAADTADVEFSCMQERFMRQPARCATVRSCGAACS